MTKKQRKQPNPNKKRIPYATGATDPMPVKKLKLSRPVRNPKSAAVRPHHIRGVCAITDPFCPAAKGSKWPDGSLGNTITEQIRYTFDVTAGTTGKQAFIWCPGLCFGLLGTASYAALPSTTATMNATYYLIKPNAAGSNSNCMAATYGDTYRVVSAGAIVRTVCSATDCAGTVTLGSCRPVPVSSNYVNGQESFQDCVVKAIQPGMEVSWISQPAGTGAHDFLPIVAATNNTLTPVTDWQCLAIETNGGVSGKTYLSVEIYMNIEFTLATNQNALAQLAKPNPPAVVHATSASSGASKAIGSFIDGGIKSVEDTVYKAAQSALKGVLDDPLTAIAGLFA